MADQNAKTSPRRVRAARLKQEVMEMRMSGASYRAIAHALGISHERARQIVKEALKEIEDVTGELVVELRKLESERLDEMQKVLWKRVKRGNLKAIDMILKIMKRRAEMFGLDETKKGEIRVVNPTIEEIIRLVFPVEDDERDNGGDGEAAETEKGPETDSAAVV